MNEEIREMIDKVKNFNQFINENVSNNIKSGVEFVYKRQPELTNIGTPEQYSRYLGSIFPNSKVKGIFYHGSPNKFSEFKQLQDQFNSTLETYKSFQAGLLTKTGNFIRKSDSPYLNKNIKYKNNDIDYVTGAGIMKKYPSMAVLNATAGKNGCPVANWTQLDSNTTPDGLILGTPIVQGQSCGNENANVRVNAVNNNATANYIGCYKDNTRRAMSNSMTNGSNNYSYEPCKSAATAGGYKYFVL